MPNLPTPGGDNGTWGDILNEFLEVGHSADGTNIGGMAETLKSISYTLAAEDNGKRHVATAAITVSVPAVGMLLSRPWQCRIRDRQS